MARKTGVTGIDHDSWQVTILPLPKRFSRGAAYGFCGGHPVGHAEALRGKSLGCWWPNGEPELLSINGRTELTAGCASGNVIPGCWKDGATGAMGAVMWELTGGQLVGREVHDVSYESSWATGAGGSAVVGVATPPPTPGERVYKVGLMWRDGVKPNAIAGTNDASVLATDGTRLAGSIRGHATLWPSVEASPVDLSPAKMSMSEVDALDGELQIGAA